MAVGESPYSGSTAHEESTRHGIHIGGGGSAHTGTDAQDRRDDKKHRRRNTKRLQKMLRKHGYKIAVDGIYGKQTRSALKHYRAGKKAKQWNHYHVDRYKGSSAKGGSSSGGGRSGGGRHRGRHGGRHKGGKMKPIKLGGGSVKKLAKSMTNQQYAGPIAELRRQLKENDAQGEQNLQDIQDWFGQVMDTHSDAVSSNEAATGHAQDDVQAATEALMSAFGGSPARQGIASAGASENAALAAIGASQRNFDTNLSSAIGQQQADSLTNEHRYQDQTEKDLRSSLVDLLREKGNAYTTNLNSAQQQQLQNEAQLQNMQIAASMSGLDRLGKIQDLRRGALDNQMLGLQIDAFKAQSGGSPFGQLAADDRAGLQENLRKLVTGRRGGFIMAPQKAYNTLGAALKRYGFTPKRGNEIDAFRDSLIREILNRTHSLGNFTKIKIGPRGVPIRPGYTKIGKNWI